MAKELITEGSKWSNGKHWMKVERTGCGEVSYNVSHAVQWIGGSCKCSSRKFRDMIEKGGYKKVYGKAKRP